MRYSIVSFASTSRSRTFDADRDDVLSMSFFSITRAFARRSSSCAMRCSSIACSFFASSYSAFSAMSPNSRALRCARRPRAACRSRGLDLLLQLLVALGSEDDFLHVTPSRDENARAPGAVAGGNGSTASRRAVKQPRGYHSRAVIDLREPWWIGPVEIPTRLVLAPMAGVSVQAFRRQGRRFGAGLVCSEMVSCAGLQHRNERTLGYLRIASDEHPLAVQIFGSEPGAMAEAARMVEAAGADIVDINFGCPVAR